jgi:hypothetical protein
MSELRCAAATPSSTAPVCAHCGTSLGGEPTRLTIRRVVVRVDPTGFSQADDRRLTGTFTCRVCTGSTRLPVSVALTAAS